MEKSVVDTAEGCRHGQTYEGDQLVEAIAKMKEAGEYNMNRFAKLYGFAYEGMETNKSEAEKLGKSI